MTDTVWRLLYDSAGKKVEQICHAQADALTALCAVTVPEGGWWRGLFETPSEDGGSSVVEDAPRCPRCLVLLEQAALVVAEPE